VMRGIVMSVWVAQLDKLAESALYLLRCGETFIRG
jgi:hypothetical protein